ncbi:hypothetical protein HHK36_029546 [Tetracentron sinense]|uniref:Uncharacterized protein n=1 Tax=Tetracentron sinense TaxID=13715 RepID=A0A835D2Q1_TETSI|nr:hypothetical protein HHK36_029546 [Tetracentron sinense]
MLGQEDKHPISGGSRRTYLRSVSWSDRSPSSPNPRPHSNSKARSCLPPLQPLSISRKSAEEWPRAASDDLEEWPHPPTPGARRGSFKPLDNSNSNSERPPRDFQLRKDKLAFFDKECSRIADHIYLGSDAVAKNREILRQNGITHVLNCVGFVCPEYFKNDLVYKTLWLQDSPSEDITSILYDVFDYFEDVRVQGGRVLVHCCQGVSRSSSLVIAYFMWRDGQNFEDAFQYVKSAREVTNPNMGFACQLLQCQKRVHALPASPNSVLRIYRMAPHSPYAPLHLVPKMLSHPGALGLDSRGAFIVHVPSAIYVWIGRNCNLVMSNSARTSAFQVVRYERAQGPIINVDEGKESSDFWDALANSSHSADNFNKMRKVREEASGVGGWAVRNDQIKAAINLGVGKIVREYDVDFEIFYKALCGGVVPPFPLSGTGSETRLPARENGWGRLRRKFCIGIVKELVTSSKLACNSSQSSNVPDVIMETCNVPDGIIETCKEVQPHVSSKEPLFSPSAPFGSPNSFSYYSNTSLKSSSKSPSPSPSPSNSSCSFTFSPASSNWSDMSFSSSQPSPSALEFTQPFVAKHAFAAENICFPCKENFPSLAEPFSAKHASRAEKNCLICKGTSPSLAERRGSHPPSLMLITSIDDPCRVSRSLVRSGSFSLLGIEEDKMKVDGCDQFDYKCFYELSKQGPISDADHFGAAHEVQVGMGDEKEYANFHLASNDSTNRVVELMHPILFQWPTMEKVQVHHVRILDSRSVFLLLAPDVNLGRNKPKSLYVWVGRDVSLEKEQSPLISTGGTNEDSHIYWEKVGSNFLNQMGLTMDVLVQDEITGRRLPLACAGHMNTCTVVSLSVGYVQTDRSLN